MIDKENKTFKKTIDVQEEITRTVGKKLCNIDGLTYWEVVWSDSEGNYIKSQWYNTDSGLLKSDSDYEKETKNIDAMPEGTEKEQKAKRERFGIAFEYHINK